LFCAEVPERVIMEKIVSICRNNDFRRIYNRGKSFVTPLVVVYVMKRKGSQVRVGITTSKKIGNAVERNRSRRVIREAFRELYPRVRRGVDLVLVARGKTPFVKSTDVKRHMEKQLMAAGVLEPAAFSAHQKVDAAP
jgi:ribonuclease P protein component